VLPADSTVDLEKENLNFLTFNYILTISLVLFGNGSLVVMPTGENLGLLYSMIILYYISTLGL